MRTKLQGTPVDILSVNETIVKIDNAISSRERLQHVALNVAKLVSLGSNATLRNDVESSDIVGIDGMGIVLALKCMGFENVSRVSGVDLMNSTLNLCAQKGYRPFFLGATPQVVEKAVSIASEHNPGLNFAGWHHGYFKESEEDALLKEINASGADCLFIAMPTPRKERLLAQWRNSLNVPFIMGVGGSFDVLAGKVKRAPAWVQRNGFEWLYRVYQEPGRMWWRYTKTNVMFSVILIRILFARLRGHSPSYSG